MNILLFVSGAFVLLAGIEWLKRVCTLPTSFLRRLAHIGAGVLNIIAPLFVEPAAIIGVNVVFALLLVVGRRHHLLSGIQNVERHTYGEIFFPLGIAVAALSMLPGHQLAFQYGVAIMGISDAVAGFVGEQWGGRVLSFVSGQKTILGSVSFFLSSVLIGVVCLPINGIGFWVLPLVLTMAEACLVFGLDNLVLPILAGVLFGLVI